MAASSNKKVLFLVTNSDKQIGEDKHRTGYYLPEAAHPYQEFTQAGFTVDFASRNGGLCPLDESSRSYLDKDPVCKGFLDNNSVTQALTNSKRITDVDLSQYAAVFAVGGHGPMFDLVDAPEVSRVLSDYYAKGGILCAVCHGPAAFVNVKDASGQPLVKDKEVTCFSDAEEKQMKLEREVPFLLESRLKQLGARVNPGAPWVATVRIDGRLITGQNPDSAAPLARAVINTINAAGGGNKAAASGEGQTLQRGEGGLATKEAAPGSGIAKTVKKGGQGSSSGGGTSSGGLSRQDQAQWTAQQQK